MQDGVSAGVLAITATVIANVDTRMRGKVLSQSVPLLPLLPGSQYCRDAKHFLPIKYLGTSSLATVGIQKK